MYNAARALVSKKMNGMQEKIHAETIIMRQHPANKRKKPMKRLTLPALAILAATAHADNEPLGTPLAMPADMAEILARPVGAPPRADSDTRAPQADNSLCTVPPTALLTAPSASYRISAAMLQNGGATARPGEDAPITVSDADIDRVAQQLAAAYPAETRAQQAQNYREHYQFYRDDSENVQTPAGALATYTLGSYNAWRGANGDDDTLNQTYQSLVAQYRGQGGNTKADKEDYLRHIMLGMQLILATAHCQDADSRARLQTAGSHGLKALFKTAPERIRLTPDGISLKL